MNHFLLSSLFLLCSAASLAQAPLAPVSGGGHYTVLQGSKTLGQAQFTATPVQGGQRLTSTGGMELPAFFYSFNNTATVDAGGNLVQDGLTGAVHSAKVSANNVQFDTASDATGREFQIRIVSDGKTTTNDVDRHRNTVLVPDLDPAAYTLMAHIALTQPRTAWVLIPKENGILVPADYQSLPDLRGTLAGQPVAVKHAVVAMGTTNAVVVELFFLEDGQLLEADLNAQNLHVVHDGFRLLNRPKPVAPPPGQAPPAADGQGAGAAGGQAPPPQ